MKYLMPFLISFGFSSILTIFFLWIGKKVRWQGRTDERHIHRKGVFRLGGLAIVLAFNATVFLTKNLVITPETFGFILGSLVLMVVGFWDDIREIYWKMQLFFQIFAAILVFIMGLRIYYVTNPLTGGILNLDTGFWVVVSIFLVIFWIVLLINAVNWIDGIDGLSGGISIVAALTIFILSLRAEVHQPPVAILSVILGGSILGFLAFNFNPAKILAGTSGAMFMGFGIAVLAIISGTKIATAILVLALPIVDFIWVIGERIRNKKSIFSPDRNHLHYKLQKLGFSQRKISLIYYSFTLIIAIVALNTRTIGKGITMVLAFLIMIIFYWLIHKKISLKTK